MQFTCFGKNYEKHMFSAPIDKEVIQELIKIEKKLKNYTFKLKFIDRKRFLASLLSNLDNNLAEGIHEIKSKLGHDKKRVLLEGGKSG